MIFTDFCRNFRYFFKLNNFSRIIAIFWKIFGTRKKCQNAIRIASGTKDRNVAKEFNQAQKADKNKTKLETERDFKIKEKMEEENAIINEKKLDKVFFYKFLFSFIF